MLSLAKKLSIKAKIILNNSVLLVLLFVAAFYAYYAINLIGQKLDQIVKEDMPLSSSISNATVFQLEQAIHFERALRYGLEKSKRNTDGLIKQEIYKFDYFSKKVHKQIDTAIELAAKGINIAHTKSEAAKFKKFNAELKEIREQHNAYEKHAREAFVAVKAHDVEAIIKLEKSITKEEDQLTKHLEAMLSEIASFTEAAVSSTKVYEENAIASLAGLTAFAIVIGVIFAFMILSSVVHPLKTVIAAMRDVSEGDGDLTRRLEVIDKHELGSICAAFNQFVEQTHNIIHKVSGASAQLASAAEELSAVTEELSQNNDSAKNEIDQVATAMNEMTATVGEVASNASNVVNIATDTDEQAKNGNQVVGNVSDIIERLAGEITNTTDVIKNLEQQSDNIGVVLDVIKNISEQTNLLALNAAIEAARAGDQGRGFAVVADEVRTLAGKTQESASQIEEMIAKLQEGAKNSVAAMGVSHDTAQRSVGEANRAGEALKNITNAVSSITNMNIQIASAAEEQKAVAEEVNRNIININETANHAAVASNQTASSSTELARLAENLQQTISRFKL